MGLISNHISGSSHKVDGQGRHAIGVSGAIYFQADGVPGQDEFGTDKNHTFAKHKDAAYIFSGSTGKNDKTLFLGDVVVSGSLSIGGGGSFVDAVAGAADNQIAVFTNGDTIEGDANLLYNGTMFQIGGAAVKAVDINASTFDVDGTGLLSLTTTQAGADAIKIEATAADGGILVDFGTGGIQFSDDAGTTDLLNIDGDSADFHASVAVNVLGDLDVDGQTNLDAVDIDGTTQIDATVTVGVNGTGYDVQFFGDTAGSHLLWDQSADELALIGAATKLSFHDAAGGENIMADAAGKLMVNAGAELEARSAIVDIQGTANSNFTVAGNSNSVAQLTLNATNTGAGEGRVSVVGGDQVSVADASNASLVLDGGVTTLDAGSTLTIGGTNATSVTLARSNQLTTVGGLLSVAQQAIFNQEVIVQGNLQVQGTTTTVSSSNTTMQDSIIGIGVSGSAGYNIVGDRGFIFGRAASANPGSALPGLKYNGTKFEMGTYTASPLSQSFGNAVSFLDLKIGSLELAGGLALPDAAGDHNLSLLANFDDMSGNRQLMFKVDDANRDLVLSGNLTVEGASIINQDLSSDSSTAQFGTLQLNTLLKADSAGGCDIGSTTDADKFGDIFLADGKFLKIGNAEEHSIIDAAPGLEIASTEAVSIKIADGQLGSLGNTALDAYFQVAAHGTAGSEDLRVVNTNGTDAKAIEILASAGGVSIECADEKAAYIGNDAKDLYVEVAPSGTPGNEDIRIVNTNGTDAKSIEILSSAGGVSIECADEKEAYIGNDAADAFVKVAASNTPGNEIVSLKNTNGTAVNSIDINSVAGGIEIESEKASQAGGVSLIAKHDASTVEIKTGGTPAVRGAFGNAVFAQPTDGYQMSFGADGEVTLTHVHDTGLILSDDSGHGATKLMFGDANTSISSPASTTLSLEAGAFIGLSVPNSVSAGVAFKAGASDLLIFNPGQVSLFPQNDNAFDLGKASNRFRNIYTADLNLRNDRGDWTLIEENDFISFRNNKTGRRFRMVMEDITGLGNYGPGNDGEM